MKSCIAKQRRPVFNMTCIFSGAQGMFGKIWEFWVNFWMEPIGASERIHKTLKGVSCKERRRKEVVHSNHLHNRSWILIGAFQKLQKNQKISSRMVLCLCRLSLFTRIFRIELRMPLFQELNLIWIEVACMMQNLRTLSYKNEFSHIHIVFFWLQDPSEHGFSVTEMEGQ